MCGQLSQNQKKLFNKNNDLRKLTVKVETSRHVRLVLYDVLGRQLDVLDQGYRSADQHRLFFNAGHLPNGIYFFALETGAERIIRRFSVIR